MKMDRRRVVSCGALDSRSLPMVSDERLLDARSGLGLATAGEQSAFPLSLTLDLQDALDAQEESVQGGDATRAPTLLRAKPHVHH